MRFIAKYKHSLIELKSTIPAIITILIIAVSVTSIMGQALDIDGVGTDTVVADTTPAAIEKKEKESTQEESTISIGDIDLSKCADGTYTGRGQGYAGYIETAVTIKDHTITKIIITDNEADDAPYLAKAKALIPDVIDSQSLDVDTISGCTYSSNGILASIEDALKQAMGEESTYNDSGKKKTSTKTSTFKDGEYNDGTYTGSAKAYRGNIDVSVTIKSGKINAIKITQTQDDEEYLAMARSVITNIIKKQTPNVDTVSGATYSSRGIINATKQALKKALKTTDNTSAELEYSEEEDSNNSSAPQISEGDTDTSGITPLDISYIDGLYYGSGIGFYETYPISVSVLIEETKITAIDVYDYIDDEDFIIPAINIIIPNVIARQGTDGVDVVSGATYSSEGILEAIDKALAGAVAED